MSRCPSWIIKGRGTRDQIANICWVIEKAREFHKNIYFCFIVYAKTFDCVDHNKLWKILKEMGIPDHLTYLLRSLYAGQEATVRTGLLLLIIKIVLSNVVWRRQWLPTPVLLSGKSHGQRSLVGFSPWGR